MGAGKRCGQGVWVVEIPAYHFDATGCERLGSGFGSITGETADAPVWLIEEGIGYRGALDGIDELMDSKDLSCVKVCKI